MDQVMDNEESTRKEKIRWKLFLEDVKEKEKGKSEVPAGYALNFWLREKSG